MPHSTKRKFGNAMYNNISAPMASSATAGAGVSGVLATTGADVFWYALAGFALLAAGMAVLRIIPRRKARNSAE